MILNLQSISFKKGITVNVLTVIDKVEKLPGDLIVRKPDNTIIGYIRDSGALQLDCADPKLEIFYVRKPHTAEPLVDGNKQRWITDTGINVVSHQ